MVKILLWLIWVSLIGDSFANQILSIEDKVIYGEDNTLFSSYATDPRFKEAAKAVAALVHDDSMIDYGSYYELKKNSTFSDNYTLCQMPETMTDRIYSVCSGFIVAPDILVTAAHCLSDRKKCHPNQKWIFGINHEMVSSDDPILISKRDSYSCKEIIEVGNNPSINVNKDYAVIRLDRSVENIIPLKYRLVGKVAENDKLVMIGHPEGAPSMLSEQGRIIDNNYFYFFKTDLDSFVGNSGSPVLNKDTALVEGIFLSGEQDYILDKERNCLNIKKCENDDCMGEYVFRITGINYIAPDRQSWLSILIGMP